MAALSIRLPFPVFTDADGQPVEGGYVWIGQANKNPRLHPVNVYFDKDLTIPADQPLRTVGGHVVHNGSPAQLFIDGTDYSILVQNRKGVDVYSFPSGIVNAATAATATKLQTARTLTIGNTGKVFDGSANVSWSLDEIGVTAFVQRALGNKQSAPIYNSSRTIEATQFGSILQFNGSSSATFTLPTPVGAAARGFLVWNNSGAPLTLSIPSGAFIGPNGNGTNSIIIHPGAVVELYSDNFNYVVVSGIATKLQTPRTLTIGNTGKNFDGSANVSWSLSEILGDRVTIDSYGRVGIGGTSESTALFIDSSIVSNETFSRGVWSRVTVPDTNTNWFVNFHSEPRTAAGSYTITGEFTHFKAQQGVLGSGSSVTYQFGFMASSSLTGATNNYGFYGNIWSATGRWNFYANGTAPNYFAGDVRCNAVITEAVSPSNNNSSATLTSTALRNHIITGTPTANITYTLPTGVSLDAAFQELQNNHAFEWSVINLAASTYTITMVGNTDHTVVGNMVVQPKTSGRFMTHKTATNTFVTYRIA